MSSSFLSQALIFQDFRTHCVFADHSAIIIHPSGGKLSTILLECVTYFSPSGTTHRQMLRHASPREEFRQKLMLSLHFRNMFSDVPIVAIPDLFPQDTHRISLHRNTQAHWRPQDVVRNSTDNTYSIQSVEKNASLSLHPNMFLFKVQFQTLLERKITRWFDQNLGIMKAGSPGSVPKACFEYVTVSQVFSVSNYPSRWSAPLYLLWNAVIQTDKQPVREPIFPSEVVQFFASRNPSYLKYCEDSFRGVNFSYISNTNELITALPYKQNKEVQKEAKTKGVRADARLRDLFFKEASSLSNNGGMSSQDMSEVNSTQQFDGWQDDAVMPTEKHIYGSYKSTNVGLLWTESSTIRQTGKPRELQILVHSDDSVLLGDGEVFEHWTHNQSDSRLRFFSAQAVPPISRNGQHQYSLSQDIEKARLLYLQPFHSNTPYMNGSKFEIEQKEQPAPKGIGPADEEVVCQSVNPGLGHFTAYRNRSIKVIFEDRTVLRLAEGESFARVLSRRGDELKVPLQNPAGYEKHVSAAQDFLVYAYSTPQQRVEVQIAAHQRDALVQLQLDKINRSLMLQKCGRSFTRPLQFPTNPIVSLPENISPNTTFERPQEILVTPKRFEFTGGKEISSDSGLSGVLSASEEVEEGGLVNQEESKSEAASGSSLSQERSFSHLVAQISDSPAGVGIDFEGIQAAVQAQETHKALDILREVRDNLQVYEPQ